jgi:hypothetical protein
MKVIAVERLAQVGRLATVSALFSHWPGVASGYDENEEKEPGGDFRGRLPSRDAA